MSAGELALIQSFHEDGMAPTREKGVVTSPRAHQIAGGTDAFDSVVGISCFSLRRPSEPDVHGMAGPLRDGVI